MIATERLILRRWRESDREPFYTMCNDHRVMEYLGPLWPRAETDAAIDRQNAFHDSLRHCFWAVERAADGAFLGFCGIKPGAAGTPIEGLPEIGWRFAFEHWGRGYAREAAQASIVWGRAHLADEAIWAITVLANVRSWGLMERLGMTRRHELDFDFPGLAQDDPLRRHITYSIAR